MERLLVDSSDEDELRRLLSLCLLSFFLSSLSFLKMSYILSNIPAALRESRNALPVLFSWAKSCACSRALSLPLLSSSDDELSLSPLFFSLLFINLFPFAVLEGLSYSGPEYSEESVSVVSFFVADALDEPLEATLDSLVFDGPCIGSSSCCCRCCCC